MTKTKRPTEKPDRWEPTRYQNLFRYVPSGNMFARFKVRGKQVRKSLGTPNLELAKNKLAALERHERAIAHERRRGKMLFGEALEEYLQFRRCDPTLKPSTQVVNPNPALSWCAFWSFPALARAKRRM